YTIITGATASSDSSYNGLTVSDVSLTNTDNDSVGVTVTPTSGLTTTTPNSGLVSTPPNTYQTVFYFNQNTVQPQLTPSNQTYNNSDTLNNIYTSNVSNTKNNITRPTIDPKLTQNIKDSNQYSLGANIPKQNKLRPAIISTSPLSPSLELYGDISTNPLSNNFLPVELSLFVNKFPSLSKTLATLGITDIDSVAKIKGQTFVVPGLNSILSLGLENSQNTQLLGVLDTTDATLTSTLPIAGLASLPTQELFARGAAGKIDLNMRLKISNTGELERTLHSTSGQTVRLSIKPDENVSEVKGEIQLLPGNNINTDHAIKNSKLLVSNFAYTDKNKDGIYEAVIEAPIAGNYKINTLAYNELKVDDVNSVIMVVDPEGYIYTEQGTQELRIDGAKVSIYWKNPINNDFELWPAKLYSQDNPQTTNKTGSYSFLVPEGQYYVQVEAKDFTVFKSKIYNVSYGTNIHENIKLTKYSWWKYFFSWIF
ncbi:MAG: hypothetical protein K9M11_04885, partial [Candidatus Pacebacteria bacterium]|nr:hypothetical protein [Candidatus Paceibacterota bacterium]